MSKDTKNKIQLIVLLIILVLVIIFAVKFFKGNSNENVDVNKTGKTAVDKTDAAYEGMDIYVKDGDTIIEDKNGSKTIETTKTKENTSMTETTEKEQKKYDITDVNVQSFGGRTVISGKVKNNDSKKHNIIIKVKFYSSDNKIKGATSANLEVDSKQAESFNMSTMDDLTKYTYKIMVEYTD